MTPTTAAVTPVSDSTVAYERGEFVGRSVAPEFINLVQFVESVLVMLPSALLSAPGVAAGWNALPDPRTPAIDSSARPGLRIDDVRRPLAAQQLTHDRFDSH